MKIALFDSEGTLGGAQRFLLDLANGLVARQWEVVVVLGAPGSLQHALTQRNIPVEVFPIASGFARWRMIARLAGYLHRNGIRRLVTNCAAGAVLGGLAIRVIGGQACWRIHQAGDLPPTPLLTRISAQLCNRVYAATDGIADSFRTHVGNDAKVLVAPPAIDLLQYPVVEPVARKRGERPVVGMLDTWESLSGHESLVKAFRLLHENGRSARLRIASLHDFPRDERYQLMVQGAIKAAGLTDRIILEGDITDIPAFLARCDVVVIPTLRETTGRLALEAAAIGRPVVASRVAGLSELIEDGHTGLLVPGDNPRALADALALLLASPALRAEMGRQAHVHVEEKYSLELLLDTLEASFLGKHPRTWVNEG